MSSHDRRIRFIPAWAGNTWLSQSEIPRNSVHPRVGGEHGEVAEQAVMAFGSSPRGRGTRRDTARFSKYGRFIPAWAGNTIGFIPNSPLPSVHPRVGGEHARTRREALAKFGSSPRGRGTQKSQWLSHPETRFIPAWAGNTDAPVGILVVYAVHPRVGGEHPQIVTREADRSGSSPRGRGTQRLSSEFCPAHRFIPAWAGNTSCCTMSAGAGPVHPRVGGEHRCIMAFTIPPYGSSPRGRGTPKKPCRGSRNRRFIPAWAGNTPHFPLLIYSVSVHPRVGGEHEG